MCPSVDAIYSWCRRKEQVDSDTGVHLSAMSNQRTLATKTILIKKCPAIRADKDIWVSFCRTGKMSVLRLFFLKSRGLVWPNLIRYFQFFSWSWPIGSLSLQKHLKQALENVFLVFFGTPVLAQLSHFWGENKAPVRPNLQRWTGFDLLIILPVKFWWFSFFLEPL